MSKRILTPRLNQLAASVAVVVGGLALVPAAHAAAPAVGTNISNIASASYNDAAGRAQTVNSNEVKTTVIQVASFTLIADRSTNSNPNNQVSLSHTLTNTGNGTDTFTINAGNIGGDNFDFNTIQVYRDADNNGIADDGNNLNGQTVTLAAGQSLNLLVVTTTPATATVGQNGKLTISATTSVAGTAPADLTKTNTDTVNVTGGAIIQVNKSASVTAVQSGDTVEYTLTYKNIGNATGTDVVLTDVIPANLTYTPGSAVWSGSGTALTDASASDDGYDFNVTQAGRVTFTIPSVAANTTGTLKFRVTVNAAAPAGSIVNTAVFNYDPDGPGPAGPTTPETTNPSTVNVAATYLGAINDSSTSNYNDAERTATLDDLQALTIAQGQTATFNTYVWNRGNSTESYNLTSVFTGLAAGTTVQLYKADGVTPLTDTSGDTTVDTGPIAPGANQLVVVKITPPSNSTASGSVTITADPVNNPSAAANDVTTLNVNITASTVDLTKNGSTNVADGDGPYDPNVIVQTASVEAGQPATFNLAITNDGTQPDNFNLSANLPSGWTVVFYDADDTTGACSSTVITNSGSIAPGATNKICAVVTPPANALPGTSDVIFNINSTVSGLSDRLKDQVVVDENRSLIFTPDRTGQVAPSGTVVYTHTLTNTGNVTEGLAGTDLNIAVGNTLAGTNTSVYVDLNNNGTADTNELVTGGNLTALLSGTPGGAGLQPGETVNIIVKVQAPANAADGQQDVATITVTPTGAINGEVAPAALKVTDVTTINNGQIRLVKEQSLDAACDGTEDGAYTQNVISGKPGQCVIYRITATNEGSVGVTTLVINDSTPAFTTLAALPTPSNDGTTGTVTAPTAGSTGTLSNPVGTLAPAASAKLKFGVKIDQ